MEILNHVKNTDSGTRRTNADGGGNGVDYTQLGMKGQIIDGVIAQVSDKVSIDFSGIGVTVPQSAVRNAREGEIRSFQITEVSKKSIVLKEVEREQGTQGAAKSILRTTVGGENGFADCLEKSEQEAKKEQAGLLSRLDSIGSRMTGEDYKDMEDEGISIESYNLERLERTLNRIKEQRLAKQEGLEDVIEQQQEYDEEIQQIVLHNVVSNVIGGSMAKQIAYRLEDANLPVTAANIKKVANLLEMASVATQMSDKAMNYLIDNELAPTIQNVYHAQYAGNSKLYNNYVPNYGGGYQSDAIQYVGATPRTDRLLIEENWQEIEPQVERIIENAGMEVNETAMKQAKWLFSNELPITDDTLERLDELHNIKNKYDQEKVLVDIVKSYAVGELPEAVSLARNQMEVTNQSVEVFLSEVDAKLREMKSQTTALSGMEDIETITKRRQMEEVRLKMTLQVANKLEGKGIDLDIQHMEQVVEELRNIEDEYYRGILYERNGIDNPEHIEILRNTTDRVNELKSAPSYVLGPTLSKMNSITLGDLNEEGRSMRMVLERAGEAYNTLMTKPREELGDSIEKAFGNIDDILEEMDMDPTIANRRAVKILGYNGMAINEDNIYNVKEYDAQVNKLISDLHPAITVEMIKRDINPLNTPVVELNDIIREIKDEIGVSGEEKYSKYLWQLEREDGISPEDKKAFIGIYRLLNNVQKSNGAAVGYVLHTNREMTLNNLLSAVTTIKSGKIDAQVDENFGLDELKYTREPLLTQVNEAFERGKATKNKDVGNRGKYFDLVVSDLMDEITPSKLEKTMVDTNGSDDHMDSLMNKNVEQLLEELKIADMDGTEDAEYEEELVKNIRELSEHCEETIAFLNNNRIPVTVQNLFAANQIYSEHSLFRNLREKAKKLPKDEQEKVEQAMDGLMEGLEDKETMQEHYRILQDSMESVLNHEYAQREVTSKELNELKMIANGMSLVYNLSNRENYEIPVLAGESVTNIHLTIVNGAKDGGKVQIQMESEALGKVNAEFFFKKEQITGMVLCDSRKASDTMKAALGDFEQRLNNADIEIGRISYGLQVRSREAYQGSAGGTEGAKDAKGLYQVAKAFVKHIAQLEK